MHSQITIERAIIHHILLDYLALIAEGNDKILETIVRIVHHDVPKNRLPTNFHHWLRLHFGFFYETRAYAAGKNSYFHTTSPLFTPAPSATATAVACPLGQNCVCHFKRGLTTPGNG